MAGEINASVPTSQKQGIPGTPASPQLQFWAGVGFALIYALIQQRAELGGLCVLVLLPSVLYRAEERPRKIATAPLTLATLMLTQRIFVGALEGVPQALFSRTAVRSWPILFVAVCLFYMPEGASWSRKLLLSFSVVVLLSGLLPGNGFLVLFACLEYLAFVAIAGGVCMDLFTTTTPRRIAM